LEADDDDDDCCCCGNVSADADGSSFKEEAEESRPLALDVATRGTGTGVLLAVVVRLATAADAAVSYGDIPIPEGTQAASVNRNNKE